MITMLSNPGSGPISGATLEQAKANLDAFLAEGQLPSDIQVSHAFNCRNGRWRWTLSYGSRSVDVEIPGCALSRVRGELGVWEQPRLYVDGSSWLWDLAIGWTRRDLGLPEISIPLAYPASKKVTR